jgi:hypothetical protein
LVAWQIGRTPALTVFVSSTLVSLPASVKVRSAPISPLPPCVTMALPDARHSLVDRTDVSDSRESKT